MGSCCSRRSARDDDQTNEGELHPSLESWKLRRRSSLSEPEVTANAGATKSENDGTIMPTESVSPSSRPFFRFPSIHYNVSANLLYDSSARSSSRSLGGSLRRHRELLPTSISSDNASINSMANASNVLSSFVHSRSVPHSTFVALNQDTSASENDLLNYEAPPSFSFATQPYIEPDFVNTAFSFHPPSQRPLMTASFAIDAVETFKLKVRHKHMFPAELSGFPNGDACSRPCSTMRRCSSDGKLIHVAGGDDQPHRRSLQEDTFARWYDVYRGTIANTHNDVSATNEHEDEFHDIDPAENILPGGYGRNKILEDIKHCISIEVNPASRHGDDWEETHNRCYDSSSESSTRSLSVVSTGDAVLFSGANFEELHLIPSKFIADEADSSSTSPRLAVGPAQFAHTYVLNDHGDDKASTLSVEDIISLLESDDMNEDALLSLLIKKSPPLSPTALSPESVLEDSLSLPLSSSSALLQMRMPSPSCTLSSPISSVRPKSPHGPISSASSSQSSLMTMPTMVTVARSPSSVSGVSSEQCSSTCRGSPTSSFDFRVRSPTSTSSTPIFSSTKRNITQLQPTVLTTEEIAEIWGVFERRQALVPPP